LAAEAVVTSETESCLRLFVVEDVVEQLLQVTLADAIDFLAGEKVSYALIGGLAASLRGEPRVTADVDLVIGTDVDGALHLLQVLEGSPFAPLFAGVEEVVSQAFILPLLHRTTAVKVDLAIGLSGFEQQLLRRATLVDLAGQAIRLATAEDLLVMKLLAGRPRDLQDATGIVMVQGDSLDWEYCRKTDQELGQAIDVDLSTQVEQLRIDHGCSD
jgi:hypothetical protein